MVYCRVVKTDAAPESYDELIQSITTSGLSAAKRSTHIAAIEKSDTITIIELWDSRADAEEYGKAVRLLARHGYKPDYRILSEEVLEVHKSF
jgi:hypothetical protein